MTTDQAPPAARTSDRGAATRSGLLAAAREVFTSVGYAQAGVTEIVTRAGASVGSLYHHFSGKADLYLTLFEELHRDQVERTRLAVRRARDRKSTRLNSSHVEISYAVFCLKKKKKKKAINKKTKKTQDT